MRLNVTPVIIKNAPIKNDVYNISNVWNISMLYEPSKLVNTYGKWWNTTKHINIPLAVSK